MSNAKKISLLIPNLPTVEHLLPYWREIDSNRRYTNFGPLVQRFEARIVRELNGIGRMQTVTTCNATLALELTLAAMDLPSDARVLLPATTFVATATAVLRAGYHPLLSDIDPDSWLLTPDIARTLLETARFDAVLPVASFGCAQDVVLWDQFQHEYGIPVLVDAAGAFGNQEIGRSTPVIFSFHATKALGCGEGACLVSCDGTLVETVRQLSNFGINPNGGDVNLVGTNAKLSEYHAAVGLASLDRWSEQRCRYLALTELYLDGLQRFCPEVTLQQRPRLGIYPILPTLLPATANALQISVQLEAAGIETRRWYCPPLYEHPAFRTCKQCGPLPNVENLNARMLGLPFHLDLTEANIEYICHTLSELLSKNRAKHASVAW